MKNYYIFWSTQTATFADDLRDAPGGPNGMVADSMAGPWRPLNASFGGVPVLLFRLVLDGERARLAPESAA